MYKDKVKSTISPSLSSPSPSSPSPSLSSPSPSSPPPAPATPSQSVPLVLPTAPPPSQGFVPPRFSPTSDYWKFTKEYIYADEGILTQVRWQCYLDFVEQGLIPLMKRFGYHIFAKPIIIVDNLCRMTYKYKNHYLKSLRYSNALHAESEDLDYYEHRLDYEIWESFWKRWSCISDFSDNCDSGRKVRTEMTYFIWSFVNVQLSSATQQLEDEYTDCEMDQGEFHEVHHKPKQETVTDDNYYATQSKFYA